MISFVKGKFNFLSAFCIVALIFITVAIMNANYMYKKIKKMNTQILSHKSDDTLLAFMIGFTLVLGLVTNITLPEKP
jgi:Na+/H+ antiporter NhaC